MLGRAPKYNVASLASDFVSVKSLLKKLTEIDDKIVFIEMASGRIDISIKKDPNRVHKVFNISAYVPRYKIDNGVRLLLQVAIHPQSKRFNQFAESGA